MDLTALTTQEGLNADLFAETIRRKETRNAMMMPTTHPGARMGVPLSASWSQGLDGTMYLTLWSQFAGTGY